MIQVHLMELFARPEVLTSPLGRVSLFLGGPPAAPVFLVVMGYFAAASRRSGPGLLLRGLKLLLLGALLNLGLNAHLLVDIWRGRLEADPRPYIMGADVLFLAAAAAALLAVLRPAARGRPWLAGAAAAAIALLSPAATSALTTASSVRWGLAFIGGGYWWSYFPWLPWLAYPLLGFAFHELAPRLATSVRTVGVASAAAACLATIAYAVAASVDLPRYYHHGPRFFAWTSLFLAAWTGLHAACEQLWGGAVPLRLLKDLGRNVTFCYMVQWLIIGNVATSLYRTQNAAQWACWVIGVTAATALALRAWSDRQRLRPGAAARAC